MEVMLGVLVALGPRVLVRSQAICQWARRRAAILASSRGAVSMEYGLLLALIALVMVGAATVLGQAISDKLDSIASGLDTAGAP